MKNSPGKNPSNILSDFGKILAEGVSKSTVLSALVLCLVIVALVTIYSMSDSAIDSFFGIAALIVCGIIFYALIIALIGIISQKRKLGIYLGEETIGSTIEPDNTFADVGAEQIKEIKEALKGAASDVSESLGISIDLVRSNVFGADKSGQMKIINGLIYNMNREEEWSISMPIGYGSTGRCFKSCHPNIAIFQEGWGEDNIEDDQLRKAHPDLRWIISVPIIGVQKKPIAVLNVDGLREAPEVQQLQKALQYLFTWSKLISLIIAKGSKKNES